jgi:hypothetical protein
LKYLSKYDSSYIAANLVEQANFPGENRSILEIFNVLKKAIDTKQSNDVIKKAISKDIKDYTTVTSKILDKSLQSFKEDVLRINNAQDFYTDVFDVDFESIDNIIKAFRKRHTGVMETSRFTTNTTSNNPIADAKKAQKKSQTSFRMNDRMISNAKEDMQEIEEFLTQDESNKYIYIQTFYKSMYKSNDNADPPTPATYIREEFIRVNNNLWAERNFINLYTNYNTILSIGTQSAINQANTHMDTMGKKLFVWHEQLLKLYVKGEELLVESTKNMEIVDRVNAANDAKSAAKVENSRMDRMDDDDTPRPPTVDDIMALALMMAF